MLRFLQPNRRIAPIDETDMNPPGGNTVKKSQSAKLQTANYRLEALQGLCNAHRQTDSGAVIQERQMSRAKPPAIPAMGAASTLLPLQCEKCKVMRGVAEYSAIDLPLACLNHRPVCVNVR